MVEELDDVSKYLIEVAKNPRQSFKFLSHGDLLRKEYGTVDNARREAWRKFPDIYNAQLLEMDLVAEEQRAGKIRNFFKKVVENLDKGPSRFKGYYLVNDVYDPGEMKAIAKMMYPRSYDRKGSRKRLIDHSGVELDVMRSRLRGTIYDKFFGDNNLGSTF